MLIELKVESRLPFHQLLMNHFIDVAAGPCPEISTVYALRGSVPNKMLLTASTFELAALVNGIVLLVGQCANCASFRSVATSPVALR